MGLEGLTMPLPGFLAVLAIVLLAGAGTVWIIACSGVSPVLIGTLALLGAGFIRMMGRVE